MLLEFCLLRNSVDFNQLGENPETKLQLYYNQTQNPTNMKLLLSMPGGSEWILLILVLSLGLLSPICAIYYYSKSKRLSQELQRVTQEKDMLLTKVLERAS